MELNHTDTILALLKAETADARRRIFETGRCDKARVAKVKELIDAKFPSWDFSAPTFIKEVIGMWKGGQAPTFTPIKPTHDTIMKSVSLLPTMGRDILNAIFAKKFCVAGGAVCDLLRGAAYFKDLDIFAPGMTVEQAESAMEELISDLRALVEKVDTALMKRIDPNSNEAPTGYVKVYRTDNCITVTVHSHFATWYEIQLITRTYRSIDEVIYGFDLSPCCVAWDGERVHSTMAAYSAYTTGVFEPDTEKRRNTFGLRVIKYCTVKGFGMVLPNLDRSCQVPLYGSTVKYCLPDLEITVRPFHGATFHYKVISMACLSHGNAGTFIQSDYGAVPYAKPEEVIEFNIKKLMLGSKFVVWENGAVVMPQDVSAAILSMLQAKKINGVKSSVLRAATVFEHLRQFTGTGLEKLAYAVMTGRPADMGSDAKTINDAFASAVNALELPPWKSASDGTDLVTGFDLTPMSAEEWYGPVYTVRPVDTKAGEWCEAKRAELSAVTQRESAEAAAPAWETVFTAASAGAAELTRAIAESTAPHTITSAIISKIADRCAAIPAGEKSQSDVDSLLALRDALLLAKALDKPNKVDIVCPAGWTDDTGSEWVLVKGPNDPNNPMQTFTLAAANVMISIKLVRKGGNLSIILGPVDE